MAEGQAGSGEYDEDDLRFLHDGYTCEENEAMLDDAQGDLNMIAETLARRGYKVDCREHDVVHWGATHWTSPCSMSSSGGAEGG